MLLLLQRLRQPICGHVDALYVPGFQEPPFRLFNDLFVSNVDGPSACLVERVYYSEVGVQAVSKQDDRLRLRSSAFLQDPGHPFCREGGWREVGELCLCRAEGNKCLLLRLLYNWCPSHKHYIATGRVLR